MHRFNESSELLQSRFIKLTLHFDDSQNGVERVYAMASGLIERWKIPTIIDKKIDLRTLFFESVNNYPTTDAVLYR
ncbi:hypothetical protein BI311_23575 (plasmid) [Xanthomonas citri pv. citri]|nr:hypothetical protein BI311_23575 [Xanthomonas citri pv. citri]